ncbi:amidohydrolase family protein [Steroidobacter sp.]|uniref:amidohydrolase family protein n=1 Tax=Steroidobacter sp. TaxID=1978227 RepID=UPI001A44735E|nr:amidohydrolase family protein [Steroidobacter sp.]MBL8269496.1 amidohydrolase family protein [Steroidobacter sp.]
MNRTFISCGVGIIVLAVFAMSSATAARRAPEFAHDPYPSTYQPRPRTDTLIVDVTILDGAGKRIDSGEVLMRDGRIVAVGHGLDRSAATVIDGKGRWLTPGVIDVHSHNGTFPMPLTSLELTASDVAESSDPNVADTWIEHAVNAQDPAFSAALRAGVTTLQILPGSTPLFAGRSVVVKPVPAVDVPSMKFPGAPQGLKMSCGENAKSFFGEKNKLPNSRQGEIAFIREALVRAQDYRDEWRAYSKGSSKKPPPRDLKLDTLAAVLDGDIPVHMHCYRASDMVAMLGVAAEFGFHITTFQHATDAYKIVPQLKQAGTCVAVWSDWWGFKMELLDAIRENAAMVDAAGGCVMMHSDSPIVGQRLTIEAAKAAAAGRRIGLEPPPEHLIRWVTSTPAKALGLATRVGTVASGFNADVVLWSGNPFSIYSKADLVFIDGALLYDRAAAENYPRSDFELGRSEIGSAP